MEDVEFMSTSTTDEKFVMTENSKISKLLDKEADMFTHGGEFNTKSKVLRTYQLPWYRRQYVNVLTW